MEDIEQRFLVPEELADKLRLNKVTIYRQIRSGRLRAYKIGRSYRIATRDAEEFLSSLRTQGTE